MCPVQPNLADNKPQQLADENDVQPDDIVAIISAQLLQNLASLHRTIERENEVQLDR